MSTLIPLAGALQKSEHVNRACEACRLLKVRCLPSPDRLSTICTRCTKTGRNCQYAAPQKRRPRKRTDTRVAELEREVKAMRSLLNKNGRTASGSRSVDGDMGEELSRKASATSYNGSERAGTSSTSVSSPDKSKQRSETPPTIHQKMHDELFYEMAADAAEDKEDDHHENVDVIDRGMITLDRATEFFNYFVNDQIPQAPLMTLRADETFEVMRAQKPIVFLVILTATAGIFDADLYAALHEETMHVFAEHYIINCGEKSLEMVQAFLLTALWLYPPDDFRKLKFYQYTHMAASMMLDIGPLEAIPIPSTPPGAEFIETKDAIPEMTSMYEGAEFEDTCYPLAPVPLKEPLEMKNEPLVVESRRTYLACYLLCSNVALSLRRPSMLTWSPFVGSCINFLKRSPCASKTDRQLAAWAEMQHIADECAAAFSLENASLHHMSDPRLQLTLKTFETRLEDWWKALDPDLINSCLSLHFHQNRIFIQEFAIMVKHSAEPVSPQPRLIDTIYSNNKQMFSAARANAILVVVESAHALLDVTIGVDMKTLRAMPVVNYARTVLAVILLIKMSATIHAPNSQLAKILDADALKVDYYVKEVVEKLQSIAEYRVASKFLPIIIKVAIWYYQNSDPKKKGHKDLIVPLLGLVVDEKHSKDTVSKLQKPKTSSFGASVLVDSIDAIKENEKRAAEAKQHSDRLPEIFSHNAEGAGHVTDMFKAHHFGPYERNIEDSPDTDTPTSSNSRNPSQASIQYQPPNQGGMANQLPLPGIAEQAPLVEGMDWFHPPADGGGLFGGGEMDIDIFALTEEAMEYGELDLMNQWFPNGNGTDMGFVTLMEQQPQPQQQGQQHQQQGQGSTGSSSWQWN